MFYLIHFLLLLSVTPRVYTKLSNTNDGGMDLALTGIISFGAITLAAYILTRLIDKPVIKISNKFAKLFF